METTHAADSRAGTVVVLGALYPWSAPLVEGLSRSGFDVVVVDRAGPELSALAEPTAPGAGRVDRLSINLTDLAGLMELAIKLPGSRPPMALVHTVPPPEASALDGRLPAGLDEEVHRGYSALAVATRSLLPGWLEAARGRVIAVGSPAHPAPWAKATVHAAVAGAVPRFLKAVDRESHSSGVHTTYLEPLGLGSPPVWPDVAETESDVHSDHRRYFLPPESVAMGVVRSLQGSVRHREWLKGPHRRSAPPPASLRRYAEREFHHLDPEPQEVREGTLGPTKETGPRLFVVTGASKGIGRASAWALARPGRRFVITGRDVPGLEETARGLRERGAQVRLAPLDLADPKSAEELRSATEAAWGTPYLLLNNAGLATIRRLENQTLEEIHQQILVNLVAPIAVTRGFLPSMLEAGRGRILFMGSSAAAVPVPRMSVYAGTKGGIQGFGIALDREVHHRGLRVSVMQPITVSTAFFRSGQTSGPSNFRNRAWWKAMTLTPEEVGAAVLRVARRPRPVVFVPPSARVLAAGLDALGPLGERFIRLPPASRRGTPPPAPSPSQG